MPALVLGAGQISEQDRQVYILPRGENNTQAKSHFEKYDGDMIVSSWQAIL